MPRTLGGFRPITPLGADAGKGGAPNPLASVPWIAQWKFNNNGNDSIGSNNLTGVNSPTFTTGKIGGATGATQLVSASTQYYTCANNTNIQTGDVDMFVCAWVYFDTVSGGQDRFIYAKGSTGAWEQDEFCLFLDSSAKPVVRIGSGAAQNQKLHTTVLTTGTWYLLYAYHDSVNNLIGVGINNGAAQTASTTIAPSSSTRTLYIGTQAGFGRMNGRIDNVCFAKGTGAVPTQAVLDALYNNGNGTETLT